MLASINFHFYGMKSGGKNAGKVFPLSAINFHLVRSRGEPRKGKVLQDFNRVMSMEKFPVIIDFPILLSNCGALSAAAFSRLKIDDRASLNHYAIINHTTKVGHFDLNASGGVDSPTKFPFHDQLLEMSAKALMNPTPFTFQHVTCWKKK